MSNKNYKFGGTIIKVVKDYCGVSQSDLALEMDVTKGYVSQLVNGRCDISMSNFLNLCEKLECDPVIILKIFIEKYSKD